MNKKTIGITLMFVIMLAFSFLMFYGLDKDPKSKLDTWSFIFVILGECMLFLSLLYTTLKEKNDGSEVGMNFVFGGYFSATLIINVLLKPCFDSVRTLTVVNIAVLLVFLFVVALDMFTKKTEE